MPRVVAVPVGSEVDFPNDDPFYHNVFSLSRPRTFNLGRYPKGQTRVVRFDKPGIVKVFCDIHSHMSAAVVVFNHPWFAIPDDEGRFEIARRSAGRPAAGRLARAAGRHHDSGARRSRPRRDRSSSPFPFPPSETPAPAGHAHARRHVHHRRGDPLGGLHGAAGGRARSRARVRNSRSCRWASAHTRASRPSGSGTQAAALAAFAESSTLKAALDTYDTEGDLEGPAKQRDAELRRHGDPRGGAAGDADVHRRRRDAGLRAAACSRAAVRPPRCCRQARC